MKSHPILFSTPMVQAILEGRKTQTRRIIKKKPRIYMIPTCVGRNNKSELDNNVPRIIPDWGKEVLVKTCPYGVVGDHLWVRETWYYESHMYDKAEGEALYRYIYKADNPEHPVNVGAGKHGWKPSIFMPKEACRINLEITNVKVERLQDITVEDAKAEGITKIQCDCGECIDSTEIGTYQDLWNSINAKRGYSWETNPFVWVISFKRIN